MTTKRNVILRRAAPLAVAALLTAALSSCGVIDGVKGAANFKTYMVPPGDVYTSNQVLTPAADVIVHHADIPVSLNMLEMRSVFQNGVQRSYGFPSQSAFNTGYLTTGNIFTQIINDLIDQYPAGQYNLNLKIVSCRYADGSDCPAAFTTVDNFPFVIAR